MTSGSEMGQTWQRTPYPSSKNRKVVSLSKGTRQSGGFVYDLYVLRTDLLYLPYRPALSVLSGPCILHHPVEKSSKAGNDALSIFCTKISFTEKPLVHNGAKEMTGDKRTEFQKHVSKFNIKSCLSDEGDIHNHLSPAAKGVVCKERQQWYCIMFCKKGS